MDMKKLLEIAGIDTNVKNTGKWSRLNESIGPTFDAMSDPELIDLCDDVFGPDWTRDVCDVEMIRGGVRLKNRDQVIHALKASHADAVGDSENEEMCGEGVFDKPLKRGPSAANANRPGPWTRDPEAVGIKYGILYADGTKKFWKTAKLRNAEYEKAIEAGENVKRIAESVETNEALGFADGFATGPRQGSERSGEQEWRAGAEPKAGGRPGIYNRKKMQKAFYKTEEERNRVFNALGGAASGLVKITESYDEDDDGLTAAEKELIKKADLDLKKKGIEVKKFDASEMVGAKKGKLDKDVEAGAKSKGDMLKDLKAHLRGEEKPATAAPAKSSKKESKPTATRGRKVDADSKSGKARDWLKQNKDATRKTFIAYATDKLGMSAAHANTAFYALKKKLIEYFVLRHPSVDNFYLAENPMMNQRQWVDPSSDLEVIVCKTLKEAEEVRKYMAEFKNQSSIIEKLSVE